MRRHAHHRLSLMRGFALFALALPGAHCTSATTTGQVTGTRSSLQDAKNAYFGRDLEAARAGFLKTMTDTGSPTKERAEAARRLATIEWRFDRDWDHALAHLDRAEQFEKGAFSTAMARARVLEHQGKLEESVAAANQALSKAENRENRLEAAIAVGRIVLLMARDANRHADDRGRRDLARSNLEKLLPWLRTERGRLELSRIILGLALLVDDGAAALDAWQSYYWIAPAQDSPAAASPPTIRDFPGLSNPHSTLLKELPRWAGSDTSSDVRATVVDALGSSGFFAEAAWVATDAQIGAGDRVDARPRVAEIVAYHQFVEAVREQSAEYYRRRALNQGANRELREALMDAARSLWKGLDWSGSEPSLRFAGLLREITKRFGTYVYFQTHGSIRSLNMGHRIVDERRSVEQYGRSAEVRLIVLDSMVTNGYNSWFWDGAASAGGWVDEEGSIVQVRPSYADGPLMAWNRLTDPDARDRIEVEIKEKSTTDDAIARANPHAYLPGLALRLRRKAGNAILTELRSGGLMGAALQSAFINELSRRTRASSILAHEGRHALDFRDPMRNFFRSHADKEFRAKLSEIALAPDPRIALTGGILAANTGDDSSHGQANERIVKGLVAWMMKHQSEIQSLDDSRPYLSQLDLLTNNQLRQAARAMDPWAD